MDKGETEEKPFVTVEGDYHDFPESVENLYEYRTAGHVYKVDGKYVVLSYSEREKCVGGILSRLLKTRVYMVPKVYLPEGVSTPDYITETGVKYDLKEIYGNGRNTIASALQKKMKQSARFILDIKDECAFSDDSIKQDVIRIISNPRTAFIKEIIVIRRSEIVMIMKKS